MTRHPERRIQFVTFELRASTRQSRFELFGAEQGFGSFHTRLVHRGDLGNFCPGAATYVKSVMHIWCVRGAALSRLIPHAGNAANRSLGPRLPLAIRLNNKKIHAHSLSRSTLAQFQRGGRGAHALFSPGGQGRLQPRRRSHLSRRVRACLPIRPKRGSLTGTGLSRTRSTTWQPSCCARFSGHHLARSMAPPRFA